MDDATLRTDYKSIIKVMRSDDITEFFIAKIVSLYQLGSNFTTFTAELVMGTQSGSNYHTDFWNYNPNYSGNTEVTISFLPVGNHGSSGSSGRDGSSTLKYVPSV